MLHLLFSCSFLVCFSIQLQLLCFLLFSFSPRRYLTTFSVLPPRRIFQNLFHTLHVTPLSFYSSPISLSTCCFWLSIGLSFRSCGGGGVSWFVFLLITQTHAAQYLPPVCLLFPFCITTRPPLELHPQRYCFIIGLFIISLNSQGFRFLCFIMPTVCRLDV